ncbi:right-handed parallel beta-helix repeat-containing protein, partial [bacterium]|nr:right-handed parallel beta-helix repeat-containing protein [bacterium]
MFRYLLSTTALLVLLNYAAHADTTYVAPGPVSGIWTTVGSPYLIYGGDIEVQESHTLTISAGVEVLFAGRYHLIVGGRLFAEGVLGDSILFSRAYPTEDSKWFGIRFDYAYEGSCLSYCRIEYVYHDDPEVEMRRGAVWIDNCSPLISHCLFTHNDAGDLGRGGALYLYFNCQSTIEYCHFIENRAYQYAGAIYISMDSSPTIYHCLFKENVVCHLNGGAINIGAGGEAVIHDNIFMGNLANNGAGKGGAICLWSGYGFYGSYS